MIRCSISLLTFADPKLLVSGQFSLQHVEGWGEMLQRVAACGLIGCTDSSFLPVEHDPVWVAHRNISRLFQREYRFATQWSCVLTPRNSGSGRPVEGVEMFR